MDCGGVPSRKPPARGIGPGAPVRIRTLTLDQVLANAGVGAVDFVSVDVEGMEADVLEGFSAARYRPRLVLVDDRARFGRCVRIMQRQGYSLVRRTGHNAWFVPRCLDWTTMTDRLSPRMALWAGPLGGVECYEPDNRSSLEAFPAPSFFAPMATI